ncbi:hemerythrin domain-containing protein [Sphaerisporangium sp. B11E5]|uniref:hemerythrin domain-containing protein n=1 Tax=Sphaerisporangium sp. B11E5 TaxID=3153563 RepID=UPI00325F390E
MSGGGEQNVVDLLIGQHTQIKEMFAELAGAQGERKRELFHELVRLLAVHESAEELVVHPAARPTAGEEIVEARLREEHEAKEALSELYDLGVEHPEFDAKCAALAQDVLEHATQEELKEFSRLRAEVPPERLVRMAGAVRAAEKIAPTRPHPAAGESAIVNMLVGPPVGVFDKVRDAVRDWHQANND